MLVAENADVAAVLLQIQLQIKGIDLGVCARRNGDRMRGFIGSDGICLLYCGRTGDIMLARGSIGIARIYQFTRQRIPLEFEGMLLVVGQILNGAIPVLGVVDLFAIQRDGLHTPCVGDDLDGALQVEIQIVTLRAIIYHARADVLGGIDLPVQLYRAVWEELHSVFYRLLLALCSVPSVCGDTANIELEILAGRVEYAAFDQHRRLVPLIRE